MKIMKLNLRPGRALSSGPTEVAVAKRPASRLNFRLKLGIIILAVFVIGSFTLPFFCPKDPSEQATYLKNLPITDKHWLGTNSLWPATGWRRCPVTL